MTRGTSRPAGIPRRLSRRGAICPASRNTRRRSPARSGLRRANKRVSKPMATPILQLEDVSRSFKKGRIEIPVLRNIDLEVNELEFLCLVGESGCGKTTTGKILAGLLEPSSGRVLFEGQAVTELRGEDYKRFRRSVQVIHQDPYASLNPTHTATINRCFLQFWHWHCR